MYRRTNKSLKSYYKSYCKPKGKTGQEPIDAQPSQQIPELRRVKAITDYDSGQPVTHKLELFKTDRVDCYKVYVDGKLWKERIG